MIIFISVSTGGNNKSMKKNDEFKYFIEQFADIQIGRYKIPDFENLPLKQKMMLYYLY